MEYLIPAIKLEQVSMRHNNKLIIDELDLTVHAGSAVALLGANGVGKSTLINIMLGLVKPTSGKIFLQGLPPTSAKARRNTGVVLQESRFIKELTVKEILHLISLHYPHPYPLEQMIEEFTLEECLSKRCAILSPGQEKLVALAAAFIGRPKLVFLDEPTQGLDVQSRLRVWKYIKSFLKNATTVFFTTHYLEEAQTIANRLIILNKGKIV